MPVIVLLTVALVGCASLTKEDCLDGNWKQVGYIDAAYGFTNARFAEHVKACNRYDIAPDRAQYDAGYAEGLVRYCQPARGFQSGRNNVTYRDICPQTMEPDFLRGYRLGRNLYQIERQIDEVTSAQSSVTDDQWALRDIEDKDERRKVRSRLDSEEYRLKKELRRLYRQRDQAKAEADAFLASLDPET